ncbi:MAG TPA: YifB family Mg chelatase-like AAA ATPase [Jatrophihabitans sp.]|jgi:magnesium chelatase family protein|uniref:YifB family Mg chelatase-like AAA ATPase n=1 Tax=Jatrophihabitans sp. TaxID=1932789 RepID=UPI002E0117F0|nr:YifB family Mg chelatase-like AAA ATPase [Jatrophihabitans sp.]
MGLAKTRAVALTGIDGQVVEVECDISAGLPGLSFTGRADSSVVESRDRMRAAMTNSGLEWPNRKITVALLPADVRKVGSRFDLAISIAVLAAAGHVRAAAVADAVWIAELGLDGRLRPVRGVLPSVVAAVRAGARRVVVARPNAEEAALVREVDVRTADHLAEVVAWLTGEGPALEPVAAEPPVDEPPSAGADLSDVAGQAIAKRALEIAAAGGHHLYLVGTPGAGKTMLAERLPGLLPPLDDDASLEVTAVHSIAGQLAGRAGLVTRPPFQAPHHTASMAALVGGGSGLASPGAISLAHHGVLFLDEAPLFSSQALDALRQPLEGGHIVLLRGGGAVRYPSRFQLVLAANPCGCGRRSADCTCAPQAKRRHEQRLSGPLLDRIDLRVQVEPVAHAELFDGFGPRESSREVAERVAAARARSAERLRGTRWSVNAAVPGSVLRSSEWLPPHRVLAEAETCLERGVLSARGFDRVLRLAWTIADLGDRLSPSPADVSEAIFFRTGRVQSWAA